MFYCGNYTFCAGRCGVRMYGLPFKSKEAKIISLIISHLYKVRCSQLFISWCRAVFGGDGGLLRVVLVSLAMSPIGIALRLMLPV